MNRFYFDIETAGLPLDQIQPIMPEFEAGANLRDPDKIKAALAEKRQTWIDNCALRATTGRIIAISTATDSAEPEFHCSPDELTMLQILNQELSEVVSQGARAYAFNGFGFDLVFFCQRCAVHGITAFKTFTTCYRGRWQWNECFVDPMQIWAGPGQRHDGASLKAVAFSLGLGLKTGNGKDFAKLLQSDPVAAKEYSLSDVKLLRGVVAAMGI